MDCEVQWPAALQKLDLSGGHYAEMKITGTLSLQLISMAQKPEDGGNGLKYSGPSKSLALPQDLPAYDLTVMDLSQFQPKGDLSIIQWPAALKVINLSRCDEIAGDLSKVQWPAALQKLKLTDCSKIEGDISKTQWPASLLSLELGGYNCKITGDLSKVQWPAGLQDLNLRFAAVSAVKWPEGLEKLFLGSTQVSGDLSKVQWPEGLTELDLGGTKVSGDLSKVQWPAALKELDLLYCEQIT
eukprot:g6018.t1